jgi:hypothetical protein
MLRAVNEGYGYLIGIAPLQFGVAVHINDGVVLAGLSTHGSHLGYRLVAQVTAVPGEYNNPLRRLREIDHVTIFHDAGDATSVARRVRRV